MTPWRRKTPMTAGRVWLGLQMIFSNVRVRDWWNPKSRKFEAPIQERFTPNDANHVERMRNVTVKNKTFNENPSPI